MNLHTEILETVKREVVNFLKHEEVAIYLFGSRARGDFTSFSDIDVAIDPQGKYNEEKITLLREHLENMNIPFKVDLVDLSGVSPSFLEHIMKERIIWKN